MAAIGETRGPFSRARALAVEAVRRGHDVAFCAAEDVNYTAVDGIRNYPAPLPSPLGTPLFVGKHLFAIAASVGLQRRKVVHSFEELLHIVGATAPKFFPEDVQAIRDAITEFQPDVVYAEFRIAAIAAARLEQAHVVTGISFPAQRSYASNPELSEGVVRFAADQGLPEISSALDIFDWAELKFVASSHELEPIEGPNVVHVGAFTTLDRPTEVHDGGKCVVAYMGNGTVTPKVLVSVMRDAFRGRAHDVFIATSGVEAFNEDNISVAKTFEFAEVMPEALAFVHHGGQNSVITGLVYGVPQIVVPGTVFERRYNAGSVARLGAGVTLETDEFQPERLRAIVQQFQADPGYRRRALRAGVTLLELGGAAKVVDVLEKRYGSHAPHALDGS